MRDWVHGLVCPVMNEEHNFLQSANQLGTVPTLHEKPMMAMQLCERDGKSKSSSSVHTPSKDSTSLHDSGKYLRPVKKHA